MPEDLIRTITSELTSGQSNNVYTVPANHTFVCFVKQANGTSGSVQLADNYGAHITISAGQKDQVKEVFEGGENGITITATPSTSDLSITLKGILFDNSGVPVRNQTSNSESGGGSSSPI